MEGGLTDNFKTTKGTELIDHLLHVVPSHQFRGSRALIRSWVRTNERKSLSTLDSQPDILPLYFSNKYITQTQNDKFTSKAGLKWNVFPRKMKFPSWNPAATLQVKKENSASVASFNWLDPHVRCKNTANNDFDVLSLRTFDVSVVVRPPQISWVYFESIAFL